MEENIPPWTPPCDSIPWYMTAFQSSPVRICRRDTGWFLSPVQRTPKKKKKRKHDGVDFYLEDGENGCWECVKVGCRRFVFEIKPTGRRQIERDGAPERQHNYIHSSSCRRMEQLIVLSPLSCRTLFQHNIHLLHLSNLSGSSVRPRGWSLSVYSSQMDELC